MTKRQLGYSHLSIYLHIWAVSVLSLNDSLKLLFPWLWSVFNKVVVVLNHVVVRYFELCGVEVFLNDMVVKCFELRGGEVFWITWWWGIYNYVVVRCFELCGGEVFWISWWLGVLNYVVVRCFELLGGVVFLNDVVVRCFY